MLLNIFTENTIISVFCLTYKITLFNVDIKSNNFNKFTVSFFKLFFFVVSKNSRVFGPKKSSLKVCLLNAVYTGQRPDRGLLSAPRSRTKYRIRTSGWPNTNTHRFWSSAIGAISSLPLVFLYPWGDEGTRR